MLAGIDPLELLAQDALIPVTFPWGATHLGPSMDPGCGSKHLPPNSRISIPLWMVKTLAQRGMIESKLPNVYGERYRRKLNAGAECVSLKNLAPNYYEVGNQLNEVMRDVELAVFLSRTFKTRYHELVSKGLNTMSGEDGLKISSKLSVEEQQLFEGGRVSITNVEAWWRGDPPASNQPRRQHPIFKRAAEFHAANQEASKQART